ncbi:YkvA family protein [Pedobacter sp. UYP30]|uniref:YkvA family protein n=1 Tax=Pedobacter sp. UYP30 TaxID=1756400 RepID=UPI003398A52C
MKAKVKRMKQDTLALYYAYQHPATPFIAKLLIGITIGYLLSPIDLIPDFIPVIGLLDDLLIVPFLIVVSIRLIPKEIWPESKLKAAQSPIILNKNNWLFASLIVAIWLALLFFFFRLFKNRHLGTKNGI